MTAAAWYSMAEAAALLGISRTRMHQLVKAGRIEATRIGKLWAVPAKEVARYQAVKGSVPKL